MEFVAVPGTKVLFSVWKVRVQDFQEFVQETHYDATNRGWFLSPDGGPAEDQVHLIGLGLSSSPLPKRGTWKNPGFKQGPTHPVCGVSWDDAHAFCSWLTKRERLTAAITQDKEYRLPTDKEWSLAAGSSQYCWGSQWPPPMGAGNFAGEEVLEPSWPTNRAIIRGYRDGFPRTSPVGSFQANGCGLYDMTGNLAEWCEDLFRKEMNSDDLRKQLPTIDLAPDHYKVTRGASWGAATPLGLTTAKHGWAAPNTRNEGTGFRVVIEGQERNR
jgi:eukaryotic-like serine/threonine-protein kinase